MNEPRAPRYGAYDFLEKWTLQELTDAESLAQGLRDSAVWDLVRRVLQERETKIVNTLLYTPNANPVQLERWRAQAAEVRQYEFLPDAIIEASKRKQAAFEQEQQRAREEGHDRHE